jgi:Ca2+-binding RTX toxin-like protein
MILGMRGRTLANPTIVALVCALSSVLAAPAAVSANPATCTYTASTHRVDIAFNDTQGVYVSRTQGGHIIVNSAWCGGAATVTNTDQIVAQGNGNINEFIVQLGYGGFAPGFTDEAGTSDEIEFSVALKGGMDDIVVYGTKADEKWVLGRANTILGVVRTINLNAKEMTGIDADLGFTSVERLDLQLGRGNDQVESTGGTGTGNLTMDTPLIVNGEDGNDTIVGGTGPDALFGGAGSDTLVGHAGDDLLFTQDGVNGNDSATGGAGSDVCHADAGDSCVP